MAVQITTEMITAAQETQQKTGVPASITLGQIMLESGGKYSGGLSGLAYSYNNLFGVHAREGEEYVTLKENASGKSINYKVYNSISEAVDDHARIITLDRYKKYYANAESVEDYAEALQLGGYATDPNYSNKLMSVINNNNLTQYDLSGGVTLDPSTSEEITIVNSETDFVWYGEILRFTSILLICVIAFVFLLKSLKINVNKKKSEVDVNE